MDDRNEVYRGRTKLAERSRYKSDPVLAQLYYKHMNGTITREELVVLNSFNNQGGLDPATKSAFQRKKKFTGALKSYFLYPEKLTN